MYALNDVVSAQIDAMHRPLSLVEQRDVKILTDAAVLIASRIAAARFRDEVDTDPKICGQIALASSEIAAGIIAIAKKQVELGVTDGK